MVSDALLFEPSSDVAHFSAITRVPGLALSVHYFEPRIRAYQDFSNTLYPDMTTIDYMDFVYAK